MSFSNLVLINQYKQIAPHVSSPRLTSLLFRVIPSIGIRFACTCSRPSDILIITSELRKVGFDIFGADRLAAFGKRLEKSLDFISELVVNHDALCMMISIGLEKQKEKKSEIQNRTDCLYAVHVA